MNAIRRHWLSGFGALLLCFWIAWVLRDHQGGVLWPESNSFFFNYLDPSRGFLEKIFDPRRNDWGQYQGRELSYAVDWLDAQLVAGSHRLGWFHFYSLLHLLGIATSALLVARIGLRQWGRSFWPVAFLLVALFLTSPSPFLTASFFRTSKILLTVCLLAIFEVLSRRPAPRAPSATLIGAIALLGTLIDRQGFFAMATLTGFFGLRWLLERDSRSLRLSLAFAGATLGGLLYNTTIGPWLIERINGYAPDFGYQRFERIDNALHFTWKDNLREGIYTLLDQIVFLFGNRRVPFGMILVALFGVGIAWRNPRRRTDLALYAYVLLAVTFLHTIMVYRHQAILWAEVRRVYYWIPEAALLILLVQWIAGRWIALVPRARPIVITLLAAALIGNVRALPDHGLHHRRGNMRRHFEETPRLLACLKEPGRDPSLFDRGPYVVTALERNCVLMRRQAASR